MFNLGPAVGVRNPEASGTAEDPYVISGWCITPAPFAIDLVKLDVVDSAGIQIAHTNEHVVIRDNHIEGVVVNVPEVSFERQDDGVRLEDADHVTVANNTITRNLDAGVTLGASADARVANNTIRNNGGNGVYGSGAPDAQIAGNAISDNRADGVHIDGSSGVRLAGNEITGNGLRGVQLFGSPDVQMTNNTVADSFLIEVQLWRSSGARMAHNTIRDSGVDIYDSDDVVLSNNTLTNSTGVSLDESSWARVVHNNIRDTDGPGLEVESESRPVNATANWWGDDSGPSGGIEDACTGEVADGAGDAIDTKGGAEVCFDPWLGSPNPDAGAS